MANRSKMASPGFLTCPKTAARSWDMIQALDASEETSRLLQDAGCEQNWGPELLETCTNSWIIMLYYVIFLFSLLYLGWLVNELQCMSGMAYSHQAELTREVACPVISSVLSAHQWPAMSRSYNFTVKVWPIAIFIAGCNFFGQKPEAAMTGGRREIVHQISPSNPVVWFTDIHWWLLIGWWLMAAGGWCQWVTFGMAMGPRSSNWWLTGWCFVARDGWFQWPEVTRACAETFLTQQFGIYGSMKPF